MSFDVRDLAVPIVQAPMAGGPSTPALAAAVSEAGGLGFLAAGYLTAEKLAADIAEVRAATAQPFGVNVFVESAQPGSAAAVDAYAESLQGEAERYGVALGEPRFDDDA
jgi:nitronate monooxygenase